MRDSPPPNGTSSFGDIVRILFVSGGLAISFLEGPEKVFSHFSRARACLEEVKAA